MFCLNKLFTNAIQDLIHQYGESVFHLVCMIVKNHALAEDITQEVFIKAYRSVESFRGELPCSEKSLLSNECISPL
ncbi:hypothetical protein C0R09_04865 [Brevibacillus laterosporus]|nr:hypothetical protein C0R09_04865 [Brevibacillus laterosporus]